jgi:hypothetical protein
MAEALRVLVGAPSFSYDNDQLTDEKIWNIAQ